MEGSKTILVTGGTGNQGGAVLRALLQQGAKVHALCRSTQSEAAKAIAELGATLLQGDLDDPESYQAHLQNIDGIFSVQAFNKNTRQEISQGCALIDAAKEAGVPHFVYASVAGADQNTGIPHFESKWEIEQHLKKSGVNHTILRPTSFYENLLNPQVKNNIHKGKLIMPLNKETTQQHISMHDIGLIGAAVLNDPQHFAYQTLTLASDQMSMQELNELFAEVLNQKMKYQKLPGLITRLAMGKDLHKMFKWMDHNEFTFADVEKLRNTFGEMTNMKTWIQQNFQ